MSEYKDKDTNSKQSGEKADAPVKLGRHRAQCSICRHPGCEEIEQAWVRWGYTRQIAEEFGVSCDAVYRHAHSTGLFARRQANFKMICEKALERIDRTIFTGSNITSMFKEYAKIILAEEKAKAERPSDAGTLQPDTTQQLDAPIPDGSPAKLVEETESAISKEPQGDRVLVKLNNDQKAVDAAQSADPKPSAQETTAKERDNGAHVGPLTKLLDEMVGAEPGKSQDGNVETQSSQTPTVQ
jgi:hypothetical protein